MPPRAAKLKRLDFNEKLVQSGKGAGADGLLKRLKTLHIALKGLEQDGTDIKSLDAVRKQLINPVILHHKDRGVKAYAACCLADILRLYAPDAEYSEEELRDIFQFFIVQITQNLKYTPNTTRPLAPSKKSNANADNQTTLTGGRITEIPYYNEYVYLLDSLATIKSIVLICDLPGADDLITTYFESFVDIVRPDMSKNLIRHLSSILTEVLNETESVPSGVMESIFSQFETHGSTPDNLSFQLVVDVCNRSALKLQRPVYAHFSEIQLQHGRDPSPSDVTVLQDSHKVLLAIFRNAPTLLMNVIPLLEENLRAADEVPLRRLSTETLGIMFAERPVVSGGVVDIARGYPSTWRAWLGRKVDKALAVRLAWVEAAGGILVHQSNAREELENDLIDRIQDSEEKVRAAICKVVGSVDYETALRNVSLRLLEAVSGRMSDKKASVHTEAINALGRLWHLASSEIEAGSEEAITHFGWIPYEMLLVLFRKDATPELKSHIVSGFKTHIVPLPAKPDDEQAWVDRFLLVASHLDTSLRSTVDGADTRTDGGLDENALKSLDNMTGLVGYARGGSPYGAYIDLCEAHNGGVNESKASDNVKDKLNYVIDIISHKLFGEPEKARKDLEKFADVNEPRLYKLFKALVSRDSDLRAIVKAKNELLRRIEQSHTSILETFTTLIDAAAWNVINLSSIGPLLKRLGKADGPRSVQIKTVAARYLALIAKECAPMYHTHVATLSVSLVDKKNDKVVEIAMQGIAALTKWDKSAGPSDKKTLERAQKLAVSGTPRQAKFAARFIAYCSEELAATELVDSIWDGLQENDDETILPLLKASSELALSVPVAFETKTAEIISFILNEVMLRPSTSEEDDDGQWVSEDELDTLDRAKLLGMRVCTHRLIGWGRERNAVELIGPTVNLLSQVLQNEGRVSDDSNEGGRTRCHMRLRAAFCIIKLAHVRAFDKAISNEFPSIAEIMQDENFGVRNGMLRKLADVLRPQRLLPKWNVLPVLVAADPEPENVALGRSIMLGVVRSCASLAADVRIDRVEMPLARLLRLLAGHPSLHPDEGNEAGLRMTGQFIEMFLDCVARRDNVSLLFTIANKLKTVCVIGEDIDDDKLRLFADCANQRATADSDDETEWEREAALSPSINLWKLSEMTQILIRGRAHHHQWPLPLFPGKIRLPSDIFNNLPSPQIAQQVSRGSYLSDAVVTWARNASRKSSTASSSSRRAAGASEGRKRSRNGTNGTKAPRKKRRSSTKRNVDDDDDDEESELSDSEDEDGISRATSEEEEEEEEAVDADGDAVMGRGGRRSAKTKAKRAVARKGKGRSAATAKAAVAKTDTESELSDIGDE
ncbi:Sister chromatid cohesion protein pds5 [Vanrija pseudolonga]|uniref:Sister chromatid cohesion protein pds5 n=1 Tax=Vanrija pseudolonga TaxID=143232 RepID=A0AAF1BHN6_9TREE|nr:Sister chromatid cohesion protein pds5 [Vanrija pseudolonga]